MTVKISSVLRRVDKFSVVERAWQGETCCIIGGGKSLTQSDVDLTRGRCSVIAVNDAYLMAPWADVCYFPDQRWHGWHKDKPEFKSFAGLKCTIETIWTAFPEDVHVLHNLGHLGFSTKPNGIHTGNHSGFQAINIAVLAGVKRIALLGFDMKPGYWHKGHPVLTPDVSWQEFLRAYQSVENQLKDLHVEVVNCSPGTSLTRFRMAPIESVLPHKTAALLQA